MFNHESKYLWILSSLLYTGSNEKTDQNGILKTKVVKFYAI